MVNHEHENSLLKQRLLRAEEELERMVNHGDEKALQRMVDHEHENHLLTQRLLRTEEELRIQVATVAFFASQEVETKKRLTHAETTVAWFINNEREIHESTTGGR
jgi:hypothetical protein